MSLPLGNIGEGSLQTTSTNFSFDPLALLAVLHNPRAAASAARLYDQHDSMTFRWPHLMMIGGALPPFKLLVDHLVSQSRSVHPAIEMHKADTGRLDVRSDIAFASLPVLHSNTWLFDQLYFQPSSFPNNDILIVHLESIHGRRVQGVSTSTAKLLLATINITNILMLTAGLVLSVLTGDMWSTVLFFTYLLHAVASIAVSLRAMIMTTPVVVREDATPRFAVYARPNGGKVIFKGRQDALETWARTAWTFSKGSVNDSIHWVWMLTGSASAAASVICMVNMAGYFQLAYLATLVFSSLGEILVTQTVRHIQQTAIHYGDTVLVKDSEFWTKSVIRASLGTIPEFSLAGLPWMAFELFPDQVSLFHNLCTLLPQLREQPALRTKAHIMRELGANGANTRVALLDRLTAEILEVEMPAGGKSV